jgi:AcrR family transcriptional regulator
LVEAAAAEFNDSGFNGTDSNKIARRAGFAPQTFYRWFKGKEEVFLQVYDRWRREEFTAISRLLAAGASDDVLAKTLVKHHKAYLRFRRSLRRLSLESSVVRAARAKSRLEQLAFLKRLIPGANLGTAQMAVLLLQMERLADALAEGEFADMGLDDAAGRKGLARLIHSLRAHG